MQVTDEMVRVAAEAMKQQRRNEIETGLCRATYEDMAKLALTAALGAMWRPISEAPKDGTRLLLRGKLQPIPSNQELYSGLELPATTAGYWDTIDVAWCIVGATWTGPFFEPTHFMHIPSPPAQEG